MRKYVPYLMILLTSIAGTIFSLMGDYWSAALFFAIALLSHFAVRAGQYVEEFPDEL